jgi:hypothetical protein
VKNALSSSSSGSAAAFAASLLAGLAFNSLTICSGVLSKL